LVKEYESTDLRKDFSIKYANDATVKDWYITKFRDVSSPQVQMVMVVTTGL
jgi:hypothetical protein